MPTTKQLIDKSGELVDQSDPNILRNSRLIQPMPNFSSKLKSKNIHLRTSPIILKPKPKNSKFDWAKQTNQQTTGGMQPRYTTKNSKFDST